MSGTYATDPVTTVLCPYVCDYFNTVLIYNPIFPFLQGVRQTWSYHHLASWYRYYLDLSVLTYATSMFVDGRNTMELVLLTMFLFESEQTAAPHDWVLAVRRKIVS